MKAVGYSVGQRAEYRHALSRLSLRLDDRQATLLLYRTRKTWSGEMKELKAYGKLANNEAAKMRDENVREWKKEKKKRQRGKEDKDIHVRLSQGWHSLPGGCGETLETPWLRFVCIFQRCLLSTVWFFPLSIHGFYRLARDASMVPNFYIDT